MDLTKIKKLYFRKRLGDLESQAITVRKRRNNGLMRLAAGGVTTVGTMSISMAALIAAMDALIPLIPVWASLPIFMLGAAAVSVLSVGAGWRYINPTERRLLPLISEPDAGEFLDENWQRRDRLLAEASSFDEALDAFKALPERAGEDEIDVGLAASMAERRARIQAEIDAYLADFNAATEAERQRVAKANRPRVRSDNGFKKSLRDFNRKVKQLAEMERGLAIFTETSGRGTSSELAPYQAVLRFREELEEERASLIRCGLKPKKLPEPRASKKFLPSGT